MIRRATPTKTNASRQLSFRSGHDQGPATMTRHTCAGPAGRREFLRAGTLALGGLSLPRLLEAREQSGLSADTSVILFWMWGGPSQLETFDPKTDSNATSAGTIT